LAWDLGIRAGDVLAATSATIGDVSEINAMFELRLFVDIDIS